MREATDQYGRNFYCSAGDWARGRPFFRNAPQSVHPAHDSLSADCPLSSRRADAPGLDVQRRLQDAGADAHHHPHPVDPQPRHPPELCRRLARERLVAQPAQYPYARRLCRCANHDFVYAGGLCLRPHEISGQRVADAAQHQPHAYPGHGDNGAPLCDDGAYVLDRDLVAGSRPFDVGAQSRNGLCAAPILPRRPQ